MGWGGGGRGFQTGKTDGNHKTALRVITKVHYIIFTNQLFTSYILFYVSYTYTAPTTITLFSLSCTYYFIHPYLRPCIPYTMLHTLLYRIFFFPYALHYFIQAWNFFLMHYIRHIYPLYTMNNFCSQSYFMYHISHISSSYIIYILVYMHWIWYSHISHIHSLYIPYILFIINYNKQSFHPFFISLWLDASFSSPL